MKLFKTIDDKKMDVDVSEIAAYQETNQGVTLFLKSGAVLNTKNSFNSVRNSVKNGAATEDE